jgi:predicted ester cyclase
MTPSTPADLLRGWFEKVWNERRADLISVYASPTSVIHALDETGGAASGPEGFRLFYDKILGALPDIHFTIHEVIESGATAAGRWTATATHQGDQLGTKATNNPVTISGMSILRTENGQIVEGWNEWDKLALAVAIGAVAPVR